MINAFPKIFHLGTDYVSKIFDGEVEVTEKIDGSQFIFGKIDGELVVRSKGRIIHDYHNIPENDLFYPVIQHIMSIENELPEGRVFYGETLCKPRHNTLKYEMTPKNHFALFAVSTKMHSFIQDHEQLTDYASNVLDTDVVPLLYRGELSSPLQVEKFMDKESYLGGTNAEGVVVKNYNQAFLLGGQPIPVMAGKFVTEAFKEVHRKSWSRENTGAGKWQMFKEGFCTEARWDKAIQHLRENGELLNEPKDIGKLIAEINRDVTEEEMENIKNFLWTHMGKEVLRVTARGFPEYYKKKLLERGFENG